MKSINAIDCLPKRHLSEDKHQFLLLKTHKMTTTLTVGVLRTSWVDGKNAGQLRAAVAWRQHGDRYSLIVLLGVVELQLHILELVLHEEEQELGTDVVVVRVTVHCHEKRLNRVKIRIHRYVRTYM